MIFMVRVVCTILYMQYVIYILYTCYILLTFVCELDYDNYCYYYIYTRAYAVIQALEHLLDFQSRPRVNDDDAKRRDQCHLTCHLTCLGGQMAC